MSAPRLVASDGLLLKIQLDFVLSFKEHRFSEILIEKL